MRPFLMTTTAVLALSMTVPAWAAEAADDQGDTAEIIVTAQKRTERLQDIPVAASVLSSESLRNQHITDLSDINKVVPSVQIKATFNGRVPYGMRGISTNANEGAIGLTSGVNIQIDGIPVPADSFAANTLSDIAQLEVLKGPQATLGGRTASAGTINFVTNGPTNDLRASVTGIVTDDKEWRVDAALSGPIANGVSFSLAGYLGRTPYPVYNTLRNEQSRADNGSIRGKLKFESGDFDITFMGHYALAKSRGENFVYQYLTPGACMLGVPAPFMCQSVTLGTNYTPHYGNTIYNSPVDMTSRYEDTDGSVVMNYKLGGATLSSTTSYFYEKQFQSQDLFLNSNYFFNLLTEGRAPPFNNMQTNDGFVRQFTQEFKVASDTNVPLSYLAGLYYAKTTVEGFGLRQFVGFPASQINRSTTESYAAYAKLTAKLNDKFSISGGLRYNWDKLGWNQNLLFDPSKGYYGTNNFGVGGFQWALSSSSGTLVGDASLQYRPDSNTMLYLSYTRGYKPAAYNTAHSFAVPQSALKSTDADTGFVNPTKRENIDSIEAGAKITALDGHLTVNADVFYTNYQNYQAQLFDTSQLVGILVLSSAGARTTGIEADVNYRQGNTSVSLSAAYIDAKFKNFPGAQCYPTQTVALGCVGGKQDLSGKALPDSPKFKLQGNIEQIVPLGSVNLVLGGSVSYRSSSILQASQNPQTYQGAFALVNASIGIQTEDGKKSLTLFANNITDHFYLTNAEEFFSGPWSGTPGIGDANAVIGQPARDSHRYFGARLTVKY